jgi:hypothetical protein
VVKLTESKAQLQLAGVQGYAKVFCNRAAAGIKTIGAGGLVLRVRALHERRIS